MIESTPPHWKRLPLGHFLTRITYGFTNPMPTTSAGPRMITAKDVRAGSIDYNSARHTYWGAYNTLLTNKSRPRPGDVVLTKDGSIGRVAVCDRDDICINQSVALLHPNSEIDSRFLAMLLQAPVYQRKMVADTGGSTIQHIYITRVDKMTIAVPELREQRAIAEVLGALDDKIGTNTRIMSTVDALLAARLSEALLSENVEKVTLGSIAMVNRRAVKPTTNGFLRYIDIAALVSFSWVGFLTRIGRHTVPCRVSGCRGQDHRDRERCARIQGMAEGPSCRTDDG